MIDLLRTAVYATVYRLGALRTADEHQQTRHRAYRAMVDQERMSHRQIAEAMRTELERMGMTEEQIRAAGVSQANITLALKTLR